jgi:8-oxo-dGTP pyrophosphatase MutT (NUDIX family)
MDDETSLPVAVRSVGAVIRVGARRFLFQHRDDKPGIIMPNCWGFFGGHVDVGEDWHAAMVRELDEELGLTGKSVAFLTEFALPRVGGWVRRKLFEVTLAESDVARLTLKEGQEMRVMTAAEFLALDKIVYWDALGLAYATQEIRA